MSQRLRRAKDRKNEIDGATMATGGHVVRYDRGVEPVVRTPQKATGDVTGDKLGGLAKASPNFKKLAEVVPVSKTEEKKVIAKATESVVPVKPVEQKLNDNVEKDNSETK